jgi:diaminopimelate epimerase
VRFEKWQALGNDYLIVEAAALPFALTPARIRRLCDRHRGPGADGVLELSPPRAGDAVARVRIFNPDGSEAELSGNGVREAILYLRRHGWTDADTFTVETVAGPIRPTITGPETCRVAMGRAALTSPAFPAGPADGRGELDAGGRTWAFRHVAIGNPQCAVPVSDPDALEALDLPALGPRFERSALFPQRTNVSFWCPEGPGRVRARIFERGVGETLSSGTGACGAAIAHVLDGGESPVTVRLDGGELEVAVDGRLAVELTGWAVPVYSAELSAELEAELVVPGSQ